jgi:hypothetical protein
VADIYLSSVDGSDSDNGSTWALAKATFAAAMTAAGVGGRVFVDHSHAESGTSITLTSPGTVASPVQVICVDRTGNPEPPTSLATTATVTATGTGDFDFGGAAYCYGITFSCGEDFRFNSASWCFKSCSLVLSRASGGSPVISTVNTAILVDLIDCQLRFGQVGARISLPYLRMRGGSIASAGSVPTTLFTSTVGRILLQGVDLSAFGSGNNLITASATGRLDYELRNCKLGSSVSFTTGSNAGPNRVELRAVNCDSADTNYRYFRHVYQGEICHESTVIRTGGASDGTTPISRKMVSTADSKPYSPLASDWITIWNETLSSLTATVHIVTDNVTLTDAEIWLEVEYLGTSGFPLSLFASDQVADPVFGTPANQASSSESWPSAPGTPVKQKLDVTFAPAEKGPIRVRVCLAKPSTTVYFDMKVDGLGFTSGRQYQSGEEYLNEGASGSCDYPSEDDVRSGVDYDSANLTGNLVLPAEEDVEDGVQYGANGTEFEGTLTGGGGAPLGFPPIGKYGPVIRGVA